MTNGGRMDSARVVMHPRSEMTARRVAKLLHCELTLSENHPKDKITLCGFDDVIEDVLPVLRTLMPGMYVRTPTLGNG